MENKPQNELEQNLQDMPLHTLARLIKRDWKKVYFGAVPYLDAMTTMVSVNDNYGADDGKSIVRYFLGNATTWRGTVAREVKKELNRRVK
jgi:hypothetical protein